jgi:hypothetical protein
MDTWSKEMSESLWLNMLAMEIFENIWMVSEGAVRFQIPTN